MLIYLTNEVSPQSGECKVLKSLSLRGMLIAYCYGPRVEHFPLESLLGQGY
jgi:hypothetical protein